MAVTSLTNLAGDGTSTNCQSCYSDTFCLQCAAGYGLLSSTGADGYAQQLCSACPDGYMSDGMSPCSMPCASLPGFSNYTFTSSSTDMSLCTSCSSLLTAAFVIVDIRWTFQATTVGMARAMCYTRARCATRATKTRPSSLALRHTMAASKVRRVSIVGYQKR